MVLLQISRFQFLSLRPSETHPWYAGKWAIHPIQVNAIQSVFTPSAERIALARKQKAAYEIAQSQGNGAINVDGVMVDAASIRINQKLLDQANLIGL